MSNSENDYVPLIRRNAKGKEIEEPVVPEEFYHRYFFNRPVGPGLDPLPKITKVTKVPKGSKTKLPSSGLNTVEMPHTTISDIQVYPAFPTPLQPSKINLSAPLTVTPYTNIQLSNTPIALTPYQYGKKGGRKTRKNKNKKNKKSRKHLRK